MLKARISVVALTILGVGASGCAAEDSGPAPGEYWENRLANSFQPPVRADLTVYTDNLDGDVQEEFISYWELFSSQGEATACDCSFDLVILEDQTEISTVSGSTKELDYEWKTVGQGSFQRDAFVFTWTWEYSESNYEAICDEYYDFRLDLYLDDGSVLHDKDSSYVPC